jgi:hypothetical protein
LKKTIGHTTRGKWEKMKKMILIFVLKFEKKMAILLEGNEKNEYATKI